MSNRQQSLWDADFERLRDADKQQIPDIQFARARFIADLAAAQSNLARRKPLTLLWLIAIVMLVACAVPIGYVIAKRLHLSIDRTLSTEQLKDSLRPQLKDAGLNNVQVDVLKSDGLSAIVVDDEGRPLPDINATATDQARKILPVIQLAILPSFALRPGEMDQLRNTIVGVDRKQFGARDVLGDSAYAAQFIRFAAAHGYQVRVFLQSNVTMVLIESRISEGKK
jgi:hypothetical protein